LVKVLIVKRDKIGDLLLTTPLFAHLKASLPGVETHLLANDYNAWVAEGNAHLDRIWVYRRVRHAGRISLGAAWDWLRKRSALRRERYDWVIVGNGDESPRAIRRGLSLGGARVVARCADAAKYPALTHPLPPDPAAHEADKLMGLLAPLGIAPPREAILPSYQLPAKSAAFTREWLAARGLAPGGYVVLGMGARRPAKQPGGAQILRWSAWWKERYGLDTVFSWTPGKADDPVYPGDDDLAKEVLLAASVGGAPQIHPHSGPLEERIGLIWSARTSVFPDSGLMHFAAASPGGVLGLFADSGVSANPAQWAPRGRRAIWLDAPRSVAELPDERIYERLEGLLSP
jgi:heptosyltransferase-3